MDGLKKNREYKRRRVLCYYCGKNYAYGSMSKHIWDIHTIKKKGNCFVPKTRYIEIKTDFVFKQSFINNEVKDTDYEI